MKMIFAVTTAIAVLAPAVAFAAEECPNVPRDQWMSDAAITERAKEQGYDVRSIKAEDGCLEVYAMDKDGKRVEVYFHPGTGDVLKVSGND
jgi:hypothetical protein